MMCRREADPEMEISGGDNALRLHANRFSSVSFRNR
jgi:hypothetical protein